MKLFQKLFRQTFIYGLATVLPRMLSFLLVPLYTAVMPPEPYGELSLVFVWFAIFNVILAYGMETAFFRFFNKENDSEKVLTTSLLALTGSTLLFALLAFLVRAPLSDFLNFDPLYFGYFIVILALDALVIIPFARLRAEEKPGIYAMVKLANVSVNIGFNLFFLLALPKLAAEDPQGLWGSLYQPNYEINYILISMVIASGITLLILSGNYLRRQWVFDQALLRRMLRYGFPVMIAGIAFTINEVFDKYLLSELLPSDIAKAEMGKYAACYKLAMFMTLFATAFRLGIEPFFFSHANSENPRRAYAQITNYFVILGSVIFLAVVVFADVLKVLFVRDEAYWDAMSVVPILLLASFFLGVYHNLSVWYKVTDRTRYGALISLVGAALTIAINLIFIPEYGYFASAWATLAAYGSMMLLSFALGKRLYPIPYNLRKIGFYLGLSVLFAALSFYVFNRNLVVGLGLLLLFLGLVYRMEKEVLLKLIRSK
ncbi:Membrane protein involved in the export of O-antigen and teichoic acid [Robiginitalea myxolifaciens]|uniref:Membrane protein involved in the export of O-antigen and teichoic acid n=1 Tax=Robiginitalea myxolifaciens TaxID=400055 RepID=A0A1I6G1T4_9FLAO|nr:oligosaccharide flippase family protein [Robiginitalea myxolifaciens]SFR36155.1 Membrane protein involved in the export of O-antigen and teichoic acid [Robiginitalea myxolifaciens]